MYKKTARGWMKHFDFFVLDLLCLGLSFLFAYWLRNGLANPWESEIYRILYIFSLLIDMIALRYLGTLKNVLKRGYDKEWANTVKHVCLVMLSTTFFLFVTRIGNSYSRIVLLLTAGFYLILSYLSRMIWKRYLLSKNVFSKGNRSLLIITSHSRLKSNIAEISKNNYGRFHLAGIALTDVDMTGQIIDGVPIVATIDTLADYVCREWIDEVFVMLSQEDHQCEPFIRQFVEMGVTVHQNLLAEEEKSGRKRLVEQLGPYTVLTTSINITTVEASVTKRILDILGGLAGCVITGILFLLIAPAIYLSSPGPIFFSQIRIGQNGRKFKLYKFRSMYLNAEERKNELMKENRVSGGMMFKLDWDPRIIGSEKGQGKGIGNFIRKYSIDEFPQFWNVLKGDMSLVGTRPPTLDEWEKYSLHHRARLAIKPGITGAWQVSGRSDITDFEEVVKLDLSYIVNWNIGLDIKILLKTVKVILGKSGAM